MQLPGVTERRRADERARARGRRPATAHAQPMPGVKNIIAVGAGKGGVGKTTVAGEPGARARKCGSKVGIIDGDIYGPNVPIMLGMKTQLTTDGQKIVPAEKYGLQVISMGFLTGDDAPIIWRGPMLHGALQQFFREVRVDRPRLPDRRHAAGHRRRGAEPQPDGAGRRRDRRHDAAAGVARRQPARGGDVQEAEHPDARHHREHELLRRARTASTRPTSSATAAASRWPTSSSVPFLGRIPIYQPIREGGDTGVPLVISEPDSPAARAFMAVAEQTAAQVSIASYTRPTIPLTVGADEHPVQQAHARRTGSTCCCTRITRARSSP